MAKKPYLLNFMQLLITITIQTISVFSLLLTFPQPQREHHHAMTQKQLEVEHCFNFQVYYLMGFFFSAFQVCIKQVKLLSELASQTILV